jgi:hypothetical protein
MDSIVVVCLFDSSSDSSVAIPPPQVLIYKITKLSTIKSPLGETPANRMSLCDDSLVKTAAFASETFVWSALHGGPSWLAETIPPGADLRLAYLIPI